MCDEINCNLLVSVPPPLRADSEYLLNLTPEFFIVIKLEELGIGLNVYVLSLKYSIINLKNLKIRIVKKYLMLMFFPNIESHELTPDVVDSVIELSLCRQNTDLLSFNFNMSSVFDSDDDRGYHSFVIEAA